MSDATLNSLGLLRADIVLPRVGAWTADVVLDDDRAPSSAITIVAAGLTLRGTVVRGGVEAGLWRGRVVGGAGGLRREVPAVAQRGGTLATALRDVLSAAGEALASAPEITDSSPLWHRLAGTAGAAVADVARAAGCAWRVLADGSVWVGRETWPEHAPDVDVIDWRPELGRLELAGDTLGILPGQTLRARDLVVRVGCVEHRIHGDASRTVVLVEPGERERGRLLDALDRLLAPLRRRVDYQALYAARVVAQDGDGRLDLVPDDARVPPCRGVPIRYGLPGVRATVPAGARVLLTYEAGDPSRPIATLWELGGVTRLVIDGGSRAAAREGHATANGSITVAAVPVPGPVPTASVVFTYVPPSGAPQTITIHGLPPSVTAVGGHALSGRIAEGAGVLHLP